MLLMRVRCCCVEERLEAPPAAADAVAVDVALDAAAAAAAAAVEALSLLLGSAVPPFLILTHPAHMHLPVQAGQGHALAVRAWLRASRPCFARQPGQYFFVHEFSLLPLESYRCATERQHNKSDKSFCVLHG